MKARTRFRIFVAVGALFALLGCIQGWLDVGGWAIFALTWVLPGYWLWQDARQESQPEA